MASVTKNVNLNVHDKVFGLGIKLVLLFIIILQINLPQSVSERFAHSLSVYTVGLNCVWIVVTGGCADPRPDGVGNYRETYVSHPNIAMVIELGK